ncbi:S1C family serine protease [Clostridium beijerinckii]|jgi:Trypsin-like serine proteases, typically periplasmic, contain C-terminal PDZ domain|uniref:Trypsin-like peptidase domain-containing protein n=2 Tax=Clostridium beijerinckii TaxID=1520 RepID=A0AAE2RQH5_CLOBE|nr:trypsin-like peptidase domain-containing protein [Clostridium beijerinckii]ABR32567.1 2-alkenal reductase [Clostridium beijerinckii NCIMB 8052]AIU03012.1 2-alkenal reductase [Clostridium beijerinckii ATCC 35702]MBF7807753.1 trypsin-like peptidase domain-containing protein [Clostridium beijerinckii]NOW88369.1 serine protease Do [Clostridium beijerinckii]NRT26202.1 serine protease Do [Clostridium beijerinckii]
MNNNDNNEKFIDVESLPVDKGQQVAWENCFQNSNNYADPKRKKRRGLRMLGRIAGILVLTMVGGAIGSAATYSFMKTNNVAATKQITSYIPQSFTSSTPDAMSAADAFNKVAPAVVIVSTKGSSNNGFMNGEVEGMGSGFIINEEGYILTNYHVIANAKEITVTLSNNTEVSATVVNYDQDRDVAMLKLKDGTKVPAVAELGDSDEVYPGAEVIAIGTPLSKNFAQTLTKGVISGSNRTIDDSGKSVDFIQTDAAINPGNSGGPLVNAKGQVIGINSMKIGSDASGSSTPVEGIGFAIPINEVKNKIDALSKPILNLGIQIREIDSATAKKYDLVEGIYVSSVEEYSPAEKGGLKIGDIIVKCDGKEAKKFDELKAIKESKNAGDTMKIEVIRDKKTVDLSVVLEEKSN